MKKLPFLLIVMVYTAFLQAQSLNDGIFMPKKVLCAGVFASQDSWDQYYEGTSLRTNGNIGTISTQMLGVMANYGISSRLNVITSLPYVQTNASAGSLTGQSGLQDLTLGFKYKAFETRIRKGALSLLGIGIITAPMTNYVADYLPLSIGIQSKTATVRANLHYLHQNGLTFFMYGGYTTRGEVKLDRNSYYTTHLIESDRVTLPNMVQIGGRAGYYKYRFQAELTLDRTAATSGNDIRRQDMPFLTNKMETTRVGLSIAYRIKPLRDVQIVLAGQQTLAGRNMGKSRAYTFGIMKAFGPAQTVVSAN
jgi:Putative MetA-pathway of phenol degradation